MHDKLFLIDPSHPGADEQVSVEGLAAALAARDGPAPIVTFPGSEAVSVFLRALPRFLPETLARRKDHRQAERIDRMLDAMLDFDPLDRAESRIDAMNAEMRRDFLTRFEVLDAAAVHDRAGHTGTNKAQTAASWGRAGRILALPYNGRMVYPAFQFDADGQPWSALRDVLKALRPDLSAWQRAIWLVAPNEWLDEAAPIDAIRGGAGEAAVAAARQGTDPVQG